MQNRTSQYIFFLEGDVVFYLHVSPKGTFYTSNVGGTHSQICPAFWNLIITVTFICEGPYSSVTG